MATGILQGSRAPPRLRRLQACCIPDFAGLRPIDGSSPRRARSVSASVAPASARYPSSGPRRDVPPSNALDDEEAHASGGLVRPHQLAKVRASTPEERRDLAQEYFDQWFTTGGEFFAAYELMVTRKSNSIAAFQLHQAAERYLCAALLVFIGTKPNIHDIEKLGNQAAPLHPLLAEPFPLATEEDKHLFDLLKRAYIEARYKRGYRITLEELAVLGERVKDLAGRVERACHEKIAGFVRPASG